ncbi:MAG: RNA polymerase sigma factor [Pseudomonadota bacterium]
MPTTLNSVFHLHRRSLMWSVMRIVRDPQTAEDLAQETYIRARKAIEAGPIEHIEAFLHQTARNLALDHQRRRRIRGEVETAAPGDAMLSGVAEDVPSIEAAILERERFETFRRSLAGLPERAQAVMILSRVEEWPNRRIAEYLDVSERTVFSDLKLAMAHCREALARLERP